MKVPEPPLTRKFTLPVGCATVTDPPLPETTGAVERWQGSVGEPETGTITLGQVVFLPGKRLVESVQTVLGSNGQSSSQA